MGQKKRGWTPPPGRGSCRKSRNFDDRKFRTGQKRGLKLGDSCYPFVRSPALVSRTLLRNTRMYNGGLAVYQYTHISASQCRPHGRKRVRKGWGRVGEPPPGSAGGDWRRVRYPSAAQHVGDGMGGGGGQRCAAKREVGRPYRAGLLCVTVRLLFFSRKSESSKPSLSQNGVGWAQPRPVPRGRPKH